ncbi:MAG: sigma-70 family RNA polymerase sigma factor [Thermoleophilaceae bacterium]
MRAAASVPATARLARPIESRRLLALANDDRLVEQIRRGSEAAFAVAFERHSPAILGFCRHMLGSLVEAEDAVQQTFASAYHDLVRTPERETMLKPWLFAIARNRCLNMLRARREQPTDNVERATETLSEQVEQRDELRQLLADLGEVPQEQRAALLLAELGNLSHAEIAGVLGCEVPRVKALVFRARNSLIQRRKARDISCTEIQEQLANLRGGSLRRNELRLHLRECSACSAYREQVKHQRSLLAVALPVAPSLGLKSSVFGAIGIGGGSAAAATGVGLTSVGGGFGSATLTKVAIVAVLAGGGAVATPALVDSVRDDNAQKRTAPAKPNQSHAAPGEAGAPVRVERSPGGDPASRVIGTRAPKVVLQGPARREDTGGRGSMGAQGHPPNKSDGAPAGRSEAHKPHKTRQEKPGSPGPSNGKSQGPSNGTARGRVAPPAATPVRRGPPTPKPAESQAAPPKAMKTVPVETPAAVAPPPGPGPKDKAAGR